MTLPAGRSSPGFTLIELMLVLMLLGLAGAIVLPNIEKGLQDRAVKRSALGLAAAARSLRSRAMDEGVPQPLVLYPVENQYRVARAAEVQLPTDVKFTEVVGGEIVDRDARQFVFFPNGSSHGGAIAMSGGKGSVTYSIYLEPLTGKIQVVPGTRS